MKYYKNISWEFFDKWRKMKIHKLDSFKSYHRLDMMGMRKHIHRSNVRYTILRYILDCWNFFFMEIRYHWFCSICINGLMTHISAEHNRDISNQSGRIATHIDDLPRSECKNMRNSTRMESISWRIKHNSISSSSLWCELLGKVFNLGINKFYISYIISHSILLSIFARRGYEFYRIDRFESTRK